VTTINAESAEIAERAERIFLDVVDREIRFLARMTSAASAPILASVDLMTEAERLNGLTGQIINAAIAVHRELGPGLLESAYKACLAYELKERGVVVETQKALPLTYRGVRLACGYRIDLLVEHAVVVEVKAIERLEPIHGAQLVTYLRQSGCKVGLVLNFNVKWLTARGIIRRVNGLEEQRAE
jgi:GxxExxY protein